MRAVPEAVMVAAFLKAEWSSARFGRDLEAVTRSLGVDEGTVVRPDLTDPRENELRARVLGEHRGYRQDRGIFQGFPAGLTWYETELPRAEIGALRYVDYSYWNALSDHTRLVGRAVANIRNGRTALGVSNDRFLALAEEIRDGGNDFEPVIVWGPPLTILEGHLRVTAFGLAGSRGPAAIRALVGLPAV